MNPLEQLSTHQPNPHISCNLVVPASASVQFSTNILSDDFRQSSFVGSVDILVIREDLECALLPLLFDLFQSSLDFLSFLFGQDAGLFEASGVGDGALYVGGVHALVVGQRLVVLVHSGVINRC